MASNQMQVELRKASRRTGMKALLLLVSWGLFFYLGYSHHKRQAGPLEARLQMALQEAETAQAELRIIRLQGLGYDLYIAIQAKNYGLAREASTKFFDAARQMLWHESDSSLRARLEKVLAQRDAITAALVRMDSDLPQKVQAIIEELKGRAGAVTLEKEEQKPSRVSPSATPSSPVPEGQAAPPAKTES